MSKVRTIKVSGVDVELHDFGYASYLYPSFNGNAEFPTTSKGYRRLSSYIRTLQWFNVLKRGGEDE